jgi:hypothetical protein
MGRLLKGVGITLIAIGLATMTGFLSFVLRDQNFQHASLLKERNPGNVMYELQYFTAFTMHVFLIGGAVSGGFLALHGGTLLAVGAVVQRRNKRLGDELDHRG